MSSEYPKFGPCSLQGSFRVSMTWVFLYVSPSDRIFAFFDNKFWNFGPIIRQTLLVDRSCCCCENARMQRRPVVCTYTKLALLVVISVYVGMISYQPPVKLRRSHSDQTRGVSPALWKNRKYLPQTLVIYHHLCCGFSLNIWATNMIAFIQTFTHPWLCIRRPPEFQQLRQQLLLSIYS